MGKIFHENFPRNHSIMPSSEAQEDYAEIQEKSPDNAGRESRLCLQFGNECILQNLRIVDTVAVT